MTVAICPILHVQQIHSTSNDGGEPSGDDVWHIRSLTNILTNTIGFPAALDDELFEVTLPAGEYLVKATGPCTNLGNGRLRLYNVTDAATLLLGPNNHSDFSTLGAAEIRMIGYFTLAGTKDLRIENWTENANFDGNMGISISQNGERYTQALFEKID